VSDSDNPLHEFEELSELDELRKANRALQQRLNKAKAKTEELVEAVYQASKEASVIIGNPPAVPKPAADNRRKRPEVAVLLCSDWHVGKHTSSFSTDVARDRIRLLGEKVVKIAEIERADHPVKEIHVLLAGDMADNINIFPGHAYEVDSTMFSQVFSVSQAIEELLRLLLARFERVVVWEQAGNHGRFGKRGDYPKADNLDRLIYRVTRERLTSPRIGWNASEDWYSIVEAGNYRALLIHGDQIKSFGGNTPAFGILRKANAWASGVLPPFQDVMMGHFHQALTLPMANGRGRVFVNPSIESDSNYAKEFVAATGTPGQRLNFVDPEKGRVTAERVIWLDEDTPPKPKLRAVA
jgi:hypothetical protein